MRRCGGQRRKPLKLAACGRNARRAWSAWRRLMFCDPNLRVTPELWSLPSVTRSPDEHPTLGCCGTRVAPAPGRPTRNSTLDIKSGVWWIHAKPLAEALKLFASINCERRKTSRVPTAAGEHTSNTEKRFTI